MKRSIFISRNLKADNPLLHELQQTGWQVEARSLISIIPLDFDLSGMEYDWIFVSSSNGARMLFSGFTPENSTRIAAVGKATADAIRGFGHEPSFIGNSGDMKEVGEIFKRAVGNGSVLFVGAEGGSKIIQSCLRKEQVRFIASYRTVIEPRKGLPDTEVVVLTSPSNAEAYLTNNTLNEKTVVAIGQTTANYLHNKGCQKVLIPESPNEEDLLRLLLGL